MRSCQPTSPADDGRTDGKRRTHSRREQARTHARDRASCQKPRVYLLPVLLQGRQGREVSGVVHDLELLEDAAHGDDIHFTAGMQPRRRGEVSSSESEASPRRSHRSVSLGRTCMYEASCEVAARVSWRVLTHRERTANSRKSRRTANFHRIQNYRPAHPHVITPGGQ